MHGGGSVLWWEIADVVEGVGDIVAFLVEMKDAGLEARHRGV